MARRILICALWIVFGTVTPARATVGGPETLEVLGYDRHDQKVYVLREFHDEGDRLPQLEYVFLRGQLRGRLLKVKSWYRGTKRDDPARFEKRLAALRGRLSPLGELPAHDFEISSRALRSIRTPAHYPGDPPWDGKEIEVRVRVAKLSGKTRVVVYGDGVEVTTARAISDRAALVVVRYRGIPFEFGYETEQLVLLGKAR